VNQLPSPILRLARVAVATALITLGCALQPALAQTTTQQQPAVPTFETPAQPAQPAPAGVPAAGQVPIFLGLLDSQALVNTSSAGKSLNTQLNNSINAIETDYQKKEQGLRDQLRQLEIARAGNPPMAVADYNAKRQALAQQDDLLQQAYDKNKQALGDRVTKAKAQMATTLRKIVQDVAKARKLTLVLDRSAAHLFAPQWDITDDVMQRLNKALPNIKL
jgi:outer membrane protein